MALYRYKGTRVDGKKASGFQPSANSAECMRDVERKGIKDISITYLADLGGIEYQIFKEVEMKSLPQKDMAYFFEQLSFLLKSGITVYQAIDILCASSNVKLAKLCLQMRPQIIEGVSLQDAMQKSNLFSKDTVFKVKAGVETGTLIDTLETVAAKTRERLDLKQEVISSMTYPVLMIIVLIVVMYAMLAYIVPSIATTISGMGGELPGITKFVMSCSDFVVAYGQYFIIGLVALIGTHIALCKKVFKYNLKMSELLYKIPLAGGLVKKMDMLDFCTSLNQLLRSGLNLPTSLNILKTTLKNVYFREEIVIVAKAVEREGLSLYDAMARHDFFSLDFLQVIMIGVNTGNLGEVLESIGTQYGKEVKSSLKQVTALIEPISILATAAIGGTCVIALYLPMFSLIEVM